MRNEIQFDLLNLNSGNSQQSQAQLEKNSIKLQHIRFEKKSTPG